MRTTVLRSAVIEAPIGRVWAVLRDFNSHLLWHPTVTESQLENDLDGDVVGGVRRFTLDSGVELREQLLYHSDAAHTYTYSILDAPLPFFDHIATLRLKPVTDGDRTFLEWRSQYRTSDDRAAELEDLVANQIYEAGIAGLRAYLFEKSAPSSRSVRKTEAPFGPDIHKGDSVPSNALVLASSSSREEALSMIQVTVPPPKTGQVRIRLTAIGINDWIAGRPSKTERSWSPSIEGVGEIIDTGSQVYGLFPGDRVAYIDDSYGAYAEIRCVDADACIPLPDAVSDAQASTLFTGISAQLLLNRIFKAPPGSTIMLQNIFGGLGHIVSQWAKPMGITVLGTVSSIDEARFSKSHGCDYPIICSQDDTVRNEVMRVTNGKGVDYWLHSSGLEGLDTAVTSLSRFGHLAVIGIRDGESILLDIATLKSRSLTVSTPVLLDYLGHRPYLQHSGHKYFTAIERKIIQPVVEKITFHAMADHPIPTHTRQTGGALSLFPGLQETS